MGEDLRRQGCNITLAASKQGCESVRPLLGASTNPVQFLSKVIRHYSPQLLTRTLYCAFPQPGHVTDARTNIPEPLFDRMQDANVRGFTASSKDSMLHPKSLQHDSPLNSVAPLIHFRVYPLSHTLKDYGVGHVRKVRGAFPLRGVRLNICNRALFRGFR